MDDKVKKRMNERKSEPKNKKKQTVSISLDSELLDAARKHADKEERSLSNYISLLLKNALSLD